MKCESGGSPQAGPRHHARSQTLLPAQRQRRFAPHGADYGATATGVNSPWRIRGDTTRSAHTHGHRIEDRQVGLLSFDEEQTEGGEKPVGEIKITSLWSDIITALGGMDRVYFALLSRHSVGFAPIPIFGRPRQPEEKIDIFVLMPFKTKLENLYTHHIKRMAEGLGVTVRRADEIFAPRPFMEKVWDGICAAKLIIADCTERNPNVFYEIGMAHTVGKKVVLITRSEKNIPSDIKHFDYIPYVYDAESVETLIEKLRAFIRSQFKL